MKSKTVLLTLLGLITAIVLVNGVALYYSLYFYIFWLDIPMHFFGGFWLGLAALWLYFLSGRFKIASEQHRTPVYVVTLSLLSALVFGGLWEGYELSLDVFIRIAEVYDIQDTGADIFMDLLGALVAAWLFIRKGYHKETIESHE